MVYILFVGWGNTKEEGNGMINDLDKIDSLLMASMKSGLISKREMFTMQCTAYEYDNLKSAYTWLERRIEQLENDK